MRHLSIDIETFSSVDLKKSGLYKYVQSSDFSILLFAYSLDDAEVEIVDLMQGETIPSEIITLLFDENTIKHAYNAPFEWYCLLKYMSENYDQYYADFVRGCTFSNSESLNREMAAYTVRQWQCTMLHGLYCGYTVGLAATGEALGLPSDKQKLNTGSALIRTFCCPVKPTGTNGNRTRTLPQHEPQKWELFKEYCKQDVVAEMEIERRLSVFPLPEILQSEWVTDQIINARGSAIDLSLVAGALDCSYEITQRLTEEAITLSGLNNPNSVAQLSKWLSKELDEDVRNLKKDTVTDLLTADIDSEKARRVLEIRQELSKTSVSKYTAIQSIVCDDGRVRGLLQFYGANRTGRWAGRLVQVQNLPRTYTEPLPLARTLVKERKTDALQLVYGSVPSTLSQLIRTAFVPKEGCVFVDADFSAIEARVIAWLAGEEWVLEVFRTHGKIYEACASQMFGVPLELIKKGNPEYALRAKGKVATLALGYQGGSGALIQMGALRDGLEESELPDIVKRWRASNKRIVDLWYAVENAALSVVKTGAPVGIKGLLFAMEQGHDGKYSMTIALPGGRKLYYVNPFLSQNDWGKDSVHYYGMNQTSKKWQVSDTYGGKLVENIVQAIARDCLSAAITNLENAGHKIVFHVHDEVIIEEAAETANLDEICAIMGRPIAWAEGLPLKAEGWIGDFYTKD